MEYKAFLEHIYQRYSGNVKLGLERMHNILAKMGNPNLTLRGIHVAGTNGKGSTSAMCEAMAMEYGFTTGLNTSPHLIDYLERIRVNGKEITYDKLFPLYQELEATFDENEASFFEITTALAFSAFAKNEVDTAVFEVGLGGRLDGTNPFNADVSVITTISYDHPKSLGDSEEKIAFEKAGIIKHKQPVIIGRMKESCKQVIREVAAEKECRFFELGKDFFVKNVRVNEHGTEFIYSFPFLNITDQEIILNLLGKHQADNAAMAITAFCLYLKKRERAIDFTKIASALMKTNWKGRMQILSREPLVIIDGAHNEEGVSVLVHNLETIFPDKKKLFIVAILRDKKLDKMIEEICTVADKIIISKNESSRAADIDEQTAVIQKTTVPYETADSLTLALQKAKEEIIDNQMIIVTGSLYTISEVMKLN
ncbi:MAG: bifunctional folylpolyglutamate synthase/dihydrofolate synthase [Candidatus Cloacimonetes bacterium]|nr:bifunctional folylpolyglutamate synthase/dihydrofolate synthase [Candidatus Cloacimonadota bacterium]